MKPAVASIDAPRREDIGQLADVAAARCPDDGLVEIRIQMDRVDPPAGRVAIVAGADRGPGQQVGEICFTGWLGLLRALQDATGESGARPGPEP